MVQDEMHPSSQSSLGTARHIKKKVLEFSLSQSKGGYAYFTIKHSLPQFYDVLQQTNEFSNGKALIT